MRLFEPVFSLRFLPRFSVNLFVDWNDCSQRLNHLKPVMTNSIWFNWTDSILLLPEYIKFLIIWEGGGVEGTF